MFDSSKLFGGLKNERCLFLIKKVNVVWKLSVPLFPIELTVVCKFSSSYVIGVNTYVKTEIIMLMMRTMVVFMRMERITKLR